MKLTPDRVVYNELIHCSVEQEKTEKPLSLRDEMLERGIPHPNRITYINSLILGLFEA